MFYVCELAPAGRRAKRSAFATSSHADWKMKTQRLQLICRLRCKKKRAKISGAIWGGERCGNLSNMFRVLIPWSDAHGQTLYLSFLHFLFKKKSFRSLAAVCCCCVFLYAAQKTPNSFLKHSIVFFSPANIFSQGGCFRVDNEHDSDPRTNFMNLTFLVKLFLCHCCFWTIFFIHI